MNETFNIYCDESCHLENDSNVKYWVSIKKREDRIHIWLENENYVVVLADRGDFLLPWTAFLVTREHTKKKLQKEHDAYWGNMS